MDQADVENLVEERMRSSLGEHKTELLKDIETIFEKISGNSNVSQLKTISEVLTTGEKVKNKSNEEQLRHNSKVKMALDEADQFLQTDKSAECRRKIVEAKDLISHRQKLIKLADSSELGWRVVSEYETNPLASDSEDERRMFKAEARATRKVTAERARKSRPSRKTCVNANETNVR